MGAVRHHSWHHSETARHHCGHQNARPFRRLRRHVSRSGSPPGRVVPGTPTGTPRVANVGVTVRNVAGGSGKAGRLAFLSHKMAASPLNTP